MKKHPHFETSGCIKAEYLYELKQLNNSLFRMTGELKQYSQCYTADVYSQFSKLYCTHVSDLNIR